MVFSGIVEEIGTVRHITETAETRLWDGSVGQGWVLTIECTVCMDGAYEGASVAVNGVCLTVTQRGANTLTFGLAPETIRRTNLGALRPGDRVNLERSLAMGARNSGHYVQGHVDCTGSILAKWREGDSLWLRMSVPLSLLPYVTEKGYIAIDGTSLTVCSVSASSPPDGEAAPAGSGVFSVMLITHTQAAVVLPSKPVGDKVNLEVDVMAKYAASAVSALSAQVSSLREAMESGLSRVSDRVRVIEERLRAVEERWAE